MRRLVLAAACAAFLTVLALPAGVSAKTIWLCKPGMAKDPCAPGLSTSVVSAASGKVVRTEHPKMQTRKRIDCFYVYPTVSDQKGLTAIRRIDPEERSIARFQAARYGQDCRVFAPMYRQVTLRGISAQESSKVTPAMRAKGYGDVVAAWKEYLRKYNHGRGVIFIGHSQGSFVLRQFLKNVVDPSVAARHRLVSAILLGGNVTVKKGSNTGGDFKHIPACRRPGQIGCVIAFSTFGGNPPSNAIFGVPSGRGTLPAKKGTVVLCTNPSVLARTAPRITPIYPSVPFAPGTIIGIATMAVGAPTYDVKTAWVSTPGAYRAACTQGRVRGLKITPLGASPKLKAIPDATWGLHLTDANIALGQLVPVAREQGRNWLRIRD
jgi:hypothetical protein